MSPFLLFSQLITKLAWKSGRSAQMSDPGRGEIAFSLFCASHQNVSLKEYFMMQPRFQVSVVANRVEGKFETLPDTCKVH